MLGRKFCPRCMAILKKNVEVCPNCGTDIAEYEYEQEKEKLAKETSKLQAEPKQELDTIKSDVEQDASAISDEKNPESEKAGDEPVDQESDVTEESKPEEKKAKRHKHKPKAKEVPQFTVDADGSYNIDTSDVTFLDNSSYSSKKERGEFKPEKIKWWEIYKWADRHLARRKIMKEVNKAARTKPVFVNKVTMSILALLLGWCGIHDFYAKNYIKGTVNAVSIILASIFVTVPALAPVATFFGGGFGLVAFYLWVTDFFTILFDKYKYRISKEAFIAKLNVETRYKISKRYLQIDKIKKEQDKILEKQRKKLAKKEAKLNAKQK